MNPSVQWYESPCHAAPMVLGDVTPIETCQTGLKSIDNTKLNEYQTEEAVGPLKILQASNGSP